MKKKILIIALVILVIIICSTIIGIKIKNKNEIIILAYHGVRDDAWGYEPMFLNVGDFEEQMKYLYEKGYTPIFLSEIKDAKKYDKPIIITFDDGYDDVYKNAFPILKKYNFKSNFFVITSAIGNDNYVTEDMLKNMNDSGIVEIGSHTANHVNLSTIKESEIDLELSESKNHLQKILNKEINTIAYPNGGYNSSVLSKVKNYYEYGVITEQGRNKKNNFDDFLLKRYNIVRNMKILKFKKILLIG